MDARILCDAMVMVENEINHAVMKHTPMLSPHDGVAKIREEWDELWDEIKTQEPDGDKMLVEASQIAATAVRFMVDVILETDANDKEVSDE